MKANRLHKQRRKQLSKRYRRHLPLASRLPDRTTMEQQRTRTWIPYHALGVAIFMLALTSLACWRLQVHAWHVRDKRIQTWGYAEYDPWDYRTPTRPTWRTLIREFLWVTYIDREPIALTINDLTPEASAAITSMGHLYQLHLTIDRLDAAMVRQLKLSDKGILHLNLKTELFTVEVARELSAIPSLVGLSVQGAEIEAGAMTRLGRRSSIRNLHVYECHFQPGVLPEIFGFSSLQRLALVDCEIPDLGLLTKARASNLVYLRISGKSFTDSHLAFIGDLPILKSLTVSDVDTDGGCLQQLQNRPNLRSLHLSNVELSSRALAHLAKQDKLVELSMDSCQLSEADEKALLAAHPKINLYNIKRLDEEQTPCSPKIGAKRASPP